MRYFTLKDDNIELKFERKKFLKVFISLAIILAFIILRNFDFITVEYNKSYLSGNFVSKREIVDFYTAYDDTYKISKNYKTFENRFTKDNSVSYLGFNLKINSKKEGKNLNKKLQTDNFLEEALKKKFAGMRFNSSQIDFTFESNENYLSVEKLEMRGFYWFPLIKKGEFTYIVELAQSDYSIRNEQYVDKYFGKYSGEINFEIYGVCSIDNLKEQIISAVYTDILATIEEDFKEYR